VDDFDRLAGAWRVHHSTLAVVDADVVVAALGIIGGVEEQQVASLECRSRWNVRKCGGLGIGDPGQRLPGRLVVGVLHKGGTVEADRGTAGAETPAGSAHTAATPAVGSTEVLQGGRDCIGPRRAITSVCRVRVARGGQDCGVRDNLPGHRFPPLVGVREGAGLHGLSSLGQRHGLEAFDLAQPLLAALAAGVEHAGGCLGVEPVAVRPPAGALLEESQAVEVAVREVGEAGLLECGRQGR
jgi:hypothetical protein